MPTREHRPQGQIDHIGLADDLGGDRGLGLGQFCAQRLDLGEACIGVGHGIAPLGVYIVLC